MELRTIVFGCRRLFFSQWLAQRMRRTEVSAQDEYAKRLKGAKTVQVMDDSLFGGQVSLYTGSLRFQQSE